MVTYLYRTRCGLEVYSMTPPVRYLPRACTHRDCDRDGCAWGLVGRRNPKEMAP